MGESQWSSNSGSISRECSAALYPCAVYSRCCCQSPCTQLRSASKYLLRSKIRESKAMLTLILGGRPAGSLFSNASVLKGMGTLASLGIAYNMLVDISRLKASSLTYLETLANWICRRIGRTLSWP